MADLDKKKKHMETCVLALCKMANNREHQFSSSPYLWTPSTSLIRKVNFHKRSKWERALFSFWWLILRRPFVGFFNVHVKRENVNSRFGFVKNGFNVSFSNENVSSLILYFWFWILYVLFPNWCLPSRRFYLV